MAVADREDWTQHALGTLERAGLRSGSARATVVELLGRQHCCLSAREISDRLRDEGNEVGIASVYRALEVLDEHKLVQRLDTGEGTTRYEPALPSGEHHHHIVCEDCGVVAPYEDDRLEEAIHALAGRLSWSVDSHDVVLRGTCPRCA
jgi:Fur family ferric uptake transcriptional regulator